MAMFRRNPASKATKEVKAAAKAGGVQLDLSGRGLAVLPGEIGTCAELQWLVVSGNALTGLPLELHSCTKLHVLDASNNEITSLNPGVLPACLPVCAPVDAFSLFFCDRWLVTCCHFPTWWKRGAWENGWQCLALSFGLRFHMR